MVENFTYHDALILNTINSSSFFFRRGANLEHIIHDGDIFDRIILSYGEIKLSLEKLLSNDLIFIKNNRVKITSKFKQKKRKKLKNKKYVFEQIKSLRLFLNTEINIDLNKPEVSVEEFITESKWETAYQDYKLNFNKRLRNL